MDFSKIDHRRAEAHPEWCFVDAQGQPQVYNGLTSVCPSGDYYQHRLFDVVDEVLDRYPVDGFFFNWMSYNEVDYSKQYRGVCQCLACRRAFAAFAPDSPLPTGPVIARLPDLERFAAATLDDLTARVRAHIAARRPETAADPRRPRRHHLPRGEQRGRTAPLAPPHQPSTSAPPRRSARTCRCWSTRSASSTCPTGWRARSRTTSPSTSSRQSRAGAHPLDLHHGHARGRSTTSASTSAARSPASTATTPRVYEISSPRPRSCWSAPIRCAARRKRSAAGHRRVPGALPRPPGAAHPLRRPARRTRSSAGPPARTAWASTRPSCCPTSARSTQRRRDPRPVRRERGRAGHHRIVRDGRRPGPTRHHADRPAAGQPGRRRSGPLTPPPGRDARSRPAGPGDRRLPHRRSQTRCRHRTPGALPGALRPAGEVPRAHPPRPARPGRRRIRQGARRGAALDRRSGLPRGRPQRPPGRCSSMPCSGWRPACRWSAGSAVGRPCPSRSRS